MKDSIHLYVCVRVHWWTRELRRFAVWHERDTKKQNEKRRGKKVSEREKNSYAFDLKKITISDVLKRDYFDLNKWTRERNRFLSLFFFCFIRTMNSGDLFHFDAARWL